MVNRHSKATQARARVEPLTFGLELISSVPVSKRRAQIRTMIAGLPSTGHKLILAIVDAGCYRLPASASYTARPISRADIAVQMKRSAGLLPNDIARLNDLVAMGILSVEKCGKLAQREGGIDGTKLTYGASWEYVYSTSLETWAALLLLDNRRAAQLEAEIEQHRRALLEKTPAQIEDEYVLKFQMKYPGATKSDALAFKDTSRPVQFQGKIWEHNGEKWTPRHLTIKERARQVFKS